MIFCQIFGVFLYFQEETQKNNLLRNEEIIVLK